MNDRLAAATVSALFVAGCASSSYQTSTPSDGTQLLEQAEIATAHTDHEGRMATRMLYRGRWVASQVNAYFRGPGLSRLEYVSPPMQGLTVVQGRNFAWRYDPQMHRIVVMGGAPGGLQQRAELARKNYEVIEGPHATIAGRDAIQIDLRPKMPGNPSRRFWVDSKTNVILGWEHFRSDGRPESHSEFQQVDFNPVPEDLFSAPKGPVADQKKVPVNLAHPMTVPELQKAVGFPLEEPGWMPAGYRQEASYISQCEDGCGAPVALTRYTDGLNSVALFQSKHLIEPVHPREADHIVRLVRNGTNYVVVGDLEQSELEKIIQSIPTTTESTPRVNLEHRDNPPIPR